MHCRLAAANLLGCPYSIGDHLMSYCRSFRDPRRLGDPRPLPICALVASGILHLFRNVSQWNALPPLICQPQYHSSLFPGVDSPRYFAPVFKTDSG